MHLDDERLQRLLDRELSPEAEPGAQAHVDACPDCRVRLAAARREEAELQHLLGLLDHAAPVVSADQIAAAARVRAGTGLRRAAVVALLAGLAGAAYAAPGSPVPTWIDAVARRIAGPPTSPSAAPASSQARDAGTAGIAVPAGARLVVSFDSSQADGEVVITLVGGATEVSVRAPGGAATFVAGVDHLVIGNRGSRASYAIDIPAEAPWVEVRVSGERVFLKDGERIVLNRGSAPAPGPYRLSLRR
jgi:hypothetical protein